MDDRAFVEQFEKMLVFLRERISPEDLSTVEGFFIGSNAQPHASLGMDSRRIIRDMQLIHAAEIEVAPFVGGVFGCDSAAGVYERALVEMGQDVTAIPSSVMREVFRAHARQGARPRVASDAVALKEGPEAARRAAERAAMFPNFGRLDRSA